MIHTLLGCSFSPCCIAEVTPRGSRLHPTGKTWATTCQGHRSDLTYCSTCADSSPSAEIDISLPTRPPKILRPWQRNYAVQRRAIAAPALPNCPMPSSPKPLQSSSLFWWTRRRRRARISPVLRRATSARSATSFRMHPTPTQIPLLQPRRVVHASSSRQCTAYIHCTRSKVCIR